MARSKFGLFWLILLLAQMVWAAPASLTYQGRIVQSHGNPLEHSNVSFLFQILDPSGSCVIYQEQRSGVNMVNSKGVFDVPIGTGTIQYPTSGGSTVLNAFDNRAAYFCGSCANSGSGYTCSATSSPYNPLLGDSRVLRVSFHDGSGWKTISPDNIIRSVPFAGFAKEAASLGGFAATDFVRRTLVPSVACTGSEVLSFDGTRFVCVTDQTGGSGGGSGSVTSVTSTNSYLTVTNGSVTPSLTVNVGQTASTVAAGNDPRFTDSRAPHGSATGDLSGNYPHPTVSKIQGVAVDFTVAPALNQVLTFDGSKWISQALPAGNAGTVTSVATGTGLSGGTITGTGTISLGGPLLGLHNMVTNGYIFRNGANTYGATSGAVGASNDTLVLRDGSGTSAFYGVNYAGATSGSVLFKAADISATYSLTLPDAQGLANQVLMTSGPTGILSWANVPSAPGTACGTGDVISYNGTAFVCVPDQVGSSGGGIASFNGQNTASQSLGTPGTSGTAPAWSSAAGVHTLNIPLASANGVTAGLISKTQYDALSAKQGALGYTPLNPTNNLSELTATASTARTNLGLGSLATASAIAGQALAQNQVWVGDSSGQAAARFFGVGDIRTAAGTAQFPSSCTAAQTMIWSAVTDVFTCTNISMSAANLTSGTLDVARLPSSVTNALWTESSGSVSRASGNVGIGTTTPPVRLSIEKPSSYSSGTVTASIAAGTRLLTTSAPMTFNKGDFIYVDSARSATIFSGGTGTTFPVLDVYSSGFAPTTFAVFPAQIHAGDFWLGGSGMASISSFGREPLHMIHHGESSTVGANILGMRARGTPSAPAKVLAGDVMAGLYGRGYADTDWSNINSGGVRIRAAENFTDSAAGTSIDFSTTALGTLSRVVQMTISSEGNVGVGTATPGARLELNRDLSVGSNTTTTPDEVLRLGFNDRVNGVSADSGLGVGVKMTFYGPSINNGYADNEVAHIGSFRESSSDTSQVTSLIFATNDGTTVAEKMRLTSAGFLGAGTASPSYRIHAVGDIYASGYFRSPNGAIQTSDVRFKENIAPIENSLQKILTINGVTYDWKRAEFPEQAFSDRHQMGVIAQEVEKSFPEAVVTDKEGYKAVSYAVLVAPLINAVKELYAKFLGQDQVLAEQSRKLAFVEKEMSELKAENQALRSAICEMNPKAAVCRAK